MSEPAPGRRLEAHRAGAVLAAGLACVLVAYLFAARPLFVPGLALVLVGAAGPLWTLAVARGASAARTGLPERVSEGEPLRADLEIRRGRLGLGSFRHFTVRDPASGAELDLGAALAAGRAVADHGRLRLLTTTRFPRRGERQLPAPALFVRDPLGLACVRVTTSTPPQRVLVLPRTEPVVWTRAQPGREDASGAGGSGDAFAANDLAGLRPYRPGTPASRIYWPALARGHGLIERRLVADGDAEPLVVLDARPATGGDLAPLDAAVRAAASLVIALARLGGCRVLLPGGGRVARVDPELGAWPALVARLAVLGADPEQPISRPPTLARVGRGGTLVYVSAAAAERRLPDLRGLRTRRALLVVPVSALVDGRPAGVGGRPVPVFDVCGCRGFALGGATSRGAHLAVSAAGSA